MSNIKFVIFDFDGVFSDGMCTYDSFGKVQKGYNIKDGMGLKLLRDNNIKIGVISGFKWNKSQDEILKHLKIEMYELGTKNKLEILDKWINELNINKEDIAYMGDDINDIEIMMTVGLSGCPKNAHKDVLDICQFISKLNGGEGCVRDFCDFILSKKPNNSIVNEIKNECFYQLNNTNLENIEKIKNKILTVNKTNNIYFTGIGKSENIAIHTCNLLKSLSFNCFYLNAVNSIHGDIGTLKENDLIILYSKSGNTKELIDIIPYLKNKKITILGVCCNCNSKFSELCDETIVLPFRKEIDCNINSIPTNSYMSFLFFTNILASSLSKNLSIENYKQNHPAGNIGKDLQKISDVLTHNFPKFILKEKLELHTILLKMTEFKIGCCFFVDENDKLLGLMTDGDIRRKIIEKSDIKYISIDDINTNFYYETDMNKLLKDCKSFGFFSVLSKKKKIIGIVRN